MKKYSCFPINKLELISIDRNICSSQFKFCPTWPRSCFNTFVFNISNACIHFSSKLDDYPIIPEPEHCVHGHNYILTTQSSNFREEKAAWKTWNVTTFVFNLVISMYHSHLWLSYCVFRFLESLQLQCRPTDNQINPKTLSDTGMSTKKGNIGRRVF